MGISVGVANPGTISGVGNATPGRVSGVSVANPTGRITVGNDYGLQGGGPVPYSSSPVNIQQPGSTPYTPVNTYASYGTGFNAPPPPVYAPKLDVFAVNAQARADAANAVNPYYTASLNKFLAQQSVLQQQQEAQTKTNIQNAQDTLKQQTEANATTATRTDEDTALKTGQINTAQDQNQVKTGDDFETARLAQAKLQAQNGVLGSGSGNRASNTAIIQRNTSEGQQNDQFQEQKDAAELFKSRTFEDLATATKNATTAEGKSETQATFDLSNYIQNLNNQTDIYKDTADKARRAEIDATTASLAKKAYSEYINGIANPAARVAGAQTYGGSF